MSIEDLQRLARSNGDRVVPEVESYDAGVSEGWKIGRASCRERV